MSSSGCRWDPLNLLVYLLLDKQAGWLVWKLDYQLHKVGGVSDFPAQHHMGGFSNIDTLPVQYSVPLSFFPVKHYGTLQGVQETYFEGVQACENMRKSDGASCV